MTTVTSTFDLTPFLRGLAQSADVPRLAAKAGGAVVALVQQRLRDYGRTHPNRLGGPTTNYYGRAADFTGLRVYGGTVDISTTQVGIDHRIYGGVITARKGKYLAIPVDVQAMGKSPRSMNLVPVIRFLNGKPRLLALAEPGTGRRMFAMKNSVRQFGDPAIMPSESEVQAAADGGVAEALK